MTEQAKLASSLTKEHIDSLDAQLNSVNFDRQSVAVENLIRDWPSIRDLALRVLDAKLKIEPRGCPTPGACSCLEVIK